MQSRSTPAGRRYSVVRDFCGHGIGQTFHAPPNVLHYGKPGGGLTLEPGMFFTIEPMINLGRPHALILDDGWTAVTRDKNLSAQWEHTVAVTEAGLRGLHPFAGRPRIAALQFLNHAQGGSRTIRRQDFHGPAPVRRTAPPCPCAGRTPRLKRTPMSSPTAVSAQQKIAGNVVLALGTSVWATHFLVTDILLANWDPYILTAGRLLSATFFLMTFYALQTQGHPLRRIPWRPALLLGSVGISISTVCLTLGVKYAGPVPAAIVASSAPIIAAFVARAGFRTPLGLAVCLGAAVAVTGGVVAALGTHDGVVGDVRGGELFILAAITLFTW